MSNAILFIFEGEKTERRLLDNLRKYFLKEEDTIVYASFNTHIYHLYQEIKTYEDEPVDTVEVLLELLGKRHSNLASLEGVSRQNIAQVFLFFDYDGHDQHADDDIISELLAYFDEESDNGKLYISYPMVEAIKHVKTDVPFESVCVPAKQNIKYKKWVSEQCDQQYNQVGRYNTKQWQTLIDAHLCKMNGLMTDTFVWPSQYFPQSEIFDKQLEKHITRSGEVAVLSSIPMLLVDYYGTEKLRKTMSYS